jgi:RNA polymerase sigma-70 factor (ECF subfamily)
MMNEEQLLAKAKQLDPNALEALHQQFYPSVARYISFKVGDVHTVEDLSGEVFVRVLEGLHRGHSWQTSVKGWIMGIAHHVVVDYYRQRHKGSDVQLDEWYASPEEAGPLYQAILSDRKQHLLQAIQWLNPEQREVILMRFIEGLDIQAVAEAINKSPGAVKALQYRAVRLLAEKMQPFAEAG